jgi:hypothetical protein
MWRLRDDVYVDWTWFALVLVALICAASFVWTFTR